MTKVAIGLPARIAEFKAVTRRAFFRFGAVAATLTIPTVLPAVAASAPLLRTKPTPRGVELLRAVKSRRDHVNSFVLSHEDIPDDAHDGHGVAEALAAIEGAPIRTMGDVVDRLIVIGECCEPGSDINQEELAAHFNAVLGALAGLTLDDCTLCSSDPDSPI